MNLYLINDFKSCGKNKEKADMLKKKSLKAYSWDMQLNIDVDKVEIAESKNGKPYFLNTGIGTDIEFNISHSKNMWICALSSDRVGIDIQKQVDTDVEKIAKRYFTVEETEYVKENGKDGFFDIWVRKEAYAKLYDMSIFSVIGDIETVQTGKLKSKLNKAYFTEVVISAEFKCVVALEKREEICIKILK